jgi:hypothetical protein
MSHPIAICIISEIDKKLKNKVSPILPLSSYSSYNYILLLTARNLKKTAQQKITIFDAYVSLKASTILGDWYLLRMCFSSIWFKWSFLKCNERSFIDLVLEAIVSIPRYRLLFFSFYLTSFKKSSTIIWSRT